MKKHTIDDYKDRMTAPIGIVVTSKPKTQKKKTKKGKK